MGAATPMQVGRRASVLNSADDSFPAVPMLPRHLLFLVLYLLSVSAIAAGSPADSETQLTWTQRPIAHFRVSYNGANAVGRVTRARGPDQPTP